MTLGASDDWNLHKQALDQGFAALSQYEVSDFLSQDISVPVTGGTRSAVTVSPQEETLLSLTAEERGRVEVELFLPSVVYAPVSEGETLGEMTLTLDGQQLAQVSMVAQQNSPEKPQEKKKLWDWLKWW